MHVVRTVHMGTALDTVHGSEMGIGRIHGPWKL
jgi:hypothetical protein